MELLNKDEARRLTAKLKKKFNLHFDRVVNFVNYRVYDVTYKLSGDLENNTLMVRQGDPFNSPSKVTAKEIGDWISANFSYDVTYRYGNIISGHYIPYVVIQCNQR